MSAEPVRVRAILRHLVPPFLQLRRSDVRVLREALVLGDFAAIAQTGHALKGLGGAYGFLEIARIGVRLESAGRRIDSREVRRAVLALEIYLDRVQVVFV